MTYTTAADVRQYTGIKFSDLGFDDQDALDTWLDARIAEIADQIDTYTRRDFTAEVTAGTIAAVPLGIEGVARDMARDLVMLAVTSRETPVVRIDDWRVRVAEPAIFTAAIKTALNQYRAKLSIRMFRVGAITAAEEEADE